MAFEMQVVSHAPLESETEPRRLASQFFSQIGYTARKGPDNGLSFRIFYDCFLMHPDKAWTVDELAAECQTSMPSVYRHLNKLKDLDIIEDLYLELDGDKKRGFRLRYGNLSKAWNFAEAHFQLAIENYRRSVDHLESLLREERGNVTMVKGRTEHAEAPVADPPVADPVEADEG